MNFKSSGLQGRLRPSLKKLPSEACLVNFTVTRRAVSLAVSILGVFALLHSIQSFGLSPFFNFHAHSSLYQISHKKDKLQSWQRGLIFATPVAAVWKGPEGSTLLCGGRCLWWDLDFLRHPRCADFDLLFLWNHFLYPSFLFHSLRQQPQGSPLPSLPRGWRSTCVFFWSSCCSSVAPSMSCGGYYSCLLE